MKKLIILFLIFGCENYAPMHPVVTIDPPAPLPTVAPTTDAGPLPPLDTHIDVEKEKQRLITLRDEIVSNSNYVELHTAHDNRIISESVQEIIDSINADTPINVFIERYRLALDFMSLSNKLMETELNTKKTLLDLLDRKREQLRLLK